MGRILYHPKKSLGNAVYFVLTESVCSRSDNYVFFFFFYLTFSLNSLPDCWLIQSRHLKMDVGEKNGVGYSPSDIASIRVERSSIENESNSILSVLWKGMTPLKSFSKSWSSWLEAQKGVWHKAFLLS